MKYIKQLFIILGITFIGECLNAILPLPIPAGVYGLFILLVCLEKKWILLESISNVGDLLLEVMPMLFIPSSVGLIVIYKDMANILLPLLVMIIGSTVFVLIVTGKVAQFIIRRNPKKSMREAKEEML